MHFSWRLTIAFSIFVLSLSSCSFEKLDCDVVTICVKNPANDPDSVIVYGWNQDEINDTLLPGECAYLEVQGVSYKEGLFSSSSTSERYQDFKTIEGVFEVDITACDMILDAPFGYIDYSNVCSNGIADFDMGEEWVDCGGPCTPCPEVTAPCSINENKIEWEELIGSDGSVDYVEFAEDYFDDTKIQFTFSTYDELEMLYHFPSFEGGSREITTGYQDHGITIKRRVYQGWSNFMAAHDQTVYLTHEGGTKYRIEFCDLAFVDGSMTIHASANLTFDKND